LVKRAGSGREFTLKGKSSFRACSEKGKASFLPADEQEATQRQAGATTKLVDRFSILVDWIMNYRFWSPDLGQGRQF